MEILPCRFCGGKGEAVIRENVKLGTAYVICTKCNAHGPSVTFEWNTHDDLVNVTRRAIELWNNRSVGKSADTKPADPGWISTKDRLPDVNSENGHIFFTENLPGYFRTFIACYKDGDKLAVAPLSFYIDGNNTPHWMVCNNVFHDWVSPILYWMELPAPPVN